MKTRRRVIRKVRSFFVEQNGPTITEYAVLLALIVVGAFGVLALIGAFLSDTYRGLSDGLPVEP